MLLKTLTKSFTPTTQTRDEFLASVRYGTYITIESNSYVCFRGPLAIIRDAGLVHGANIAITGDRTIQITEL